jgi:hypothetical protein
MNEPNKVLVVTGAFACFVACVGDSLITFILGNKYHGYSQIHDVMSLLGSSKSPVSVEFSTWWIILGLLIIVFASAFRIAFSPAGKFLKIAFWLLVLYGIGDCMGSGLFKADKINGVMTSSYFVHNIFGGIGICALLFFPLVVERISPLNLSNIFVIFSRVVFGTGVIFLILYSFRFLGTGNNAIERSAGLWQRLFVFDYYIYFLVIAFLMVKKVLD